MMPTGCYSIAVSFKPRDFGIKLGTPGGFLLSIDASKAETKNRKSNFMMIFLIILCYYDIQRNV